MVAAKFPNRRRDSPAIPATASQPPLKINNYFELARSLQCISHRARWSGPAKLKRDYPMFANFAAARETATILAGAFVSALLLVSAATSLPIA
jgi:hypothetical protein